jgi:hypothetical protein
MNLFRPAPFPDPSWHTSLQRGRESIQDGSARIETAREKLESPGGKQPQRLNLDPSSWQ